MPEGESRQQERQERFVIALEDAAEDHTEDAGHHQGMQQRPANAQRRAPVALAQVDANQRPPEEAELPDARQVRCQKDLSLKRARSASVPAVRRLVLRSCQERESSRSVAKQEIPSSSF